MRTFLLSLSLCLTVLTASAQEATKISLSAPLDYQVFQRGTPKDGKITIAGSLEVPQGVSAPQVLLARVTGEGADGKWAPVVFDPQVPAFRAELSAPAGGWYRFEIKAWTQGKAVAEAAVEHVGVGEVFIVAGQSNSANHGEEKLSSQSGKVSSFSGSKWQVAHDPQPGASGSGGSFLPAFGDAMAERFKVPVGLVATGVGATSVREWLPPGVRFTNPPTLVRNTVTVGRGAYESTGGIYANLVNRMKALGREGFRAVLWHQGESDANQQQPDRTLQGSMYQTLLETLIASAQRDSGTKAPWFVAQASYHGPQDAGSADIRLAQRMTWESGTALEGPDSDSLTGEMRERGGQGVHFSGQGLREHGRLWVEKVAPWLEARLAGKDLTKSYVKLPPMFSDGAVLQREVPVPVWGSAGAGESITVEFAGQKQTAAADAKGAWKATLAPLTASSTGQTLIVRGKDEMRTLKDVLVGEVWLASGQSNMHWTFAPGHTVANNEEELAAANDPLVRQFTTGKKGVNAPAANVSGVWHRATRNDLLTGGAAGDSALGYFFARELKAKLGVPVAILNSSVGGTPIEQWSPGGGLYNAMIHPLAPFAVRGALWYQGESNCMKLDGAKYTTSQMNMVSAWRKLWAQGDFPFLYVQIAPYVYSGRPNSLLTNETLPEFWMAQTAAMKQANTGMVVINDITASATNIHPPNKQDVGRRLVLWALAKAYGQPRLIHCGPLFKDAKAEGGKLRVTFDHTGGGLTTKDGQPPAHLEVASADGKFVPASGVIDGETLLVHSDAVAQPAAVRYGWDEKAMPNLANKEGLPAAPFHSQKWPR